MDEIGFPDINQSASKSVAFADQDKKDERTTELRPQTVIPLIQAPDDFRRVSFS
jgi:hypothetical protein